MRHPQVLLRSPPPKVRARKPSDLSPKPREQWLHIAGTRSTTPPVLEVLDTARARAPASSGARSPRSTIAVDPERARWNRCAKPPPRGTVVYKRMGFDEAFARRPERPRAMVRLIAQHAIAAALERSARLRSRRWGRSTPSDHRISRARTRAVQPRLFYAEGQALNNPSAKRGYSRDKRPDCKQVVVSVSSSTAAFPRRTRSSTATPGPNASFRRCSTHSKRPFARRWWSSTGGVRREPRAAACEGARVASRQGERTRWQTSGPSRRVHSHAPRRRSRSSPHRGSFERGAKAKGPRHRDKHERRLLPAPRQVPVADELKIEAIGRITVPAGSPSMPTHRRYAIRSTNHGVHSPSVSIVQIRRPERRGSMALRMHEEPARRATDLPSSSATRGDPHLLVRAPTICSS